MRSDAPFRMEQWRLGRRICPFSGVRSSLVCSCGSPASGARRSRAIRPRRRRRALPSRSYDAQRKVDERDQRGRNGSRGSGRQEEGVPAFGSPAARPPPSSQPRLWPCAILARSTAARSETNRLDTPVALGRLPCLATGIPRPNDHWPLGGHSMPIHVTCQPFVLAMVGVMGAPLANRTAIRNPVGVASYTALPPVRAQCVEVPPSDVT